MDTILLTGATGFLGSALLRKLCERGYSVRITVRPRSMLQHLQGMEGIETVQADITNAADIDRAMRGCDRVYHCAGLYRSWLPDFDQLRRVNVEGTRHVLAAARRAGVRKVVYTSSIAALGMRPDGLPAGEDTRFNLHHLRLPYEQSKFEAEQVAREFIAEGLPLVILRPAMIMGPGDLYPTPSGKIVLDLLRGMVPCYFDGGIDIVDVDDVAQAHLTAMDTADPGESFNVGCMGNYTKMGDLFRLIARIGSVRPPFLKLPAQVVALYAAALTFFADSFTHREPLATPANIRLLSLKRRVDFSKAVRMLGMPQTPLAQVVARTINWYRKKGYV